MNALVFLIANVDAVIGDYQTHVEGRVFSATYPPYLKDRASELLEGKKYTIWNTDIVVRVFGDRTVNVSFCPRKARQLAVDDFRHAICPDAYSDIERAGIVCEWTRQHWVSKKVEPGSVTGSICIMMKDFMNIVSKHRNGKSPEHVIRRKYTSVHEVISATFEIRKSVLLKEAGGSTAEEGNVSLAEPGKNEIPPHVVARRVAVTRAWRDAQEINSIIADASSRADQKQYSEEHAKQLASLDALIASPSMPDACKTLLRGCRHQFERADTYDQPGGERSMDKIVPMFNILYGKDLTKEQGWMFMALVKAVRSANGDYSADSYEDGSMYIGLADEDAKKERK